MRRSRAGSRAGPELSGRRAISPLVPILLPQVVTAIVLALVFARVFPAKNSSEAVPPAAFTDVTAAAGLDYRHDNGSRPGLETPSTLAGAVAFLDYDGDGRPDIFFVGGTRWPWARPEPGMPAAGALYHNDGGGHFTDATRAAGLDLDFLGMGVAVGDYDNDGRPDLFVTGVGGNHLFHNLGGGKFAEVTDAAGVRGDSRVWSTGAVWIDLYGDGRPGLVVCNYARWAPGTDLKTAFAAEAAGPSYAMPEGFASVFPTVYRNLGHGKFVDVTSRTGLDRADPQTGLPRAFPLAVAAVDLNGSGKLDLLFTYQNGDDVLYLNQGNGTFREWRPPAEGRHEGISAGLAAASEPAFFGLGQTADRLGVLRAAGLALASTSAEDETFCPLRSKLGVALLDYDLDGRMDLVSGNGRAEPSLTRFEHGRDFASRPSLLWNNGRGWTEIPLSSAASASGPAAPVPPLVARGVAVADVYGDGYPDILIAQNGGPPRLLRNDLRFGRVRHAWLKIDLVGTRCARDADGARVEVHTPRRTLVQTMEPATGFMAQSEKTLTFGLGDDDRVGRVVVRWPDGTRQQVRPPGVNRRLVIVEP